MPLMRMAATYHRRPMALAVGPNRGGASTSGPSYAGDQAGDTARFLSPKSTRRLVPTPMSEINGNQKPRSRDPDACFGRLAAVSL